MPHFSFASALAPFCFLLSAGLNAAEGDGTAARGAVDQAGASRTQTPAKALEAAALITKGKTYALARPYDEKMPIFPGRSFTLTGTGSASGGSPVNGQAVYNDDFLATQIGQVGSQIDALGHVAIIADGEEVYFGGLKGADVHGPRGLRALGAEHIRPFFTRGVLIDIEGYKGRPLLAGEVISLADLHGALRAENIDPERIGEGDVVLIHTGWGRYWATDKPKYLYGSPGIGMEVARWLAAKRVAIVGSDTMTVEAIPPPRPDLVMAVHAELIARNGIFLMEGLATENLVEDQVWEFAFSFAPMAITGATGAPATALAIR